MSTSVFNGLLYGGDMAPGVKQAHEGLRKLSVEDYRKSVSVSMATWQTPPSPNLALGDVTYVRLDIHNTQIADLRETIRFWRYVYLTMCVQFFVVTVAAIWGWAR